jgi:hypothetical protein
MDGLGVLLFSQTEQERLFLALFIAFLNSSRDRDAFGRFCFWKIYIFDAVKNPQSSTRFPT